MPTSQECWDNIWKSFNIKPGTQQEILVAAALLPTNLGLHILELFTCWKESRASHSYGQGESALLNDNTGPAMLLRPEPLIINHIFIQNN